MSILVEEIMTRFDQLNAQELKELEQAFEQRAKPGVESLRLVRMIENTQWQRFVLRVGKITRKTLLWTTLLGVLALSAFLVIFLLRTETISTGTRRDQFQAGISYIVERHRYRNVSTVTFDDGGDGQVICRLSPMKVEQVAEERWLANGRAIYLNLVLRSPEALGADGKPEARSAKLLYDFHRGELYVASPLHLWRTASSESHWMNDEEFTGLLNRFTQ